MLAIRSGKETSAVALHRDVSRDTEKSGLPMTIDLWLAASPRRRIADVRSFNGCVDLTLIDEHGFRVPARGATFLEALDVALREHERASIEARAETDLEDERFLVALSVEQRKAV